MESPRATRSTRSTILGKRSTRDQTPVTPEQTPEHKRARNSSIGVDGDGNKENVAPIRGSLSTESPPRITRPFRRTTTELETPSRTHSTARRTPSSSTLAPTTPTHSITHLSLNTPPPTPPEMLLPVHVRARSSLRSTCNNPSQIAGRERELNVIMEFLESFTTFTDTSSNTSTALYISGPPGTGKTAIVNSALRRFDTKFLFINCMALSNVDELWDCLLDHLVGSRSVAKRRHARGKPAVEAALSGSQSKLILVLDEMDHIAVSPSSLAQIFSLPSNAIGTIGIANTHTLTANTHLPSCVRTLHFAPYSPPELLAILRSRLAPLSLPAAFLPPAALTLLTKKIAAQTGDVRMLFEVLRVAIELSATTRSSDCDSSPSDSPALSVTPAHILSALKAYSPVSTSIRSSQSASPSAKVTNVTSVSNVAERNCAIVATVRKLGLQARLALLSLILASKRVDARLSLCPSMSSSSVSKAISQTLETTGLYTFYVGLLRGTDAFMSVSRSDFDDLVGLLETVGLARLFRRVSVRGKGRVRGSFAKKPNGEEDKRIVLADGIRVDEVLRGLGIAAVSLSGASAEGLSANVKEEELRAIWDRECRRIERDMKAVKKEAYCAEAFEGAIED